MAGGPGGEQREGGAAGSQAGPSLSGTAERIRQILVSAEALAEAIHREATEAADRYLAERRQEADALLAASRQQAEALIAASMREADALLDARREQLAQALLSLRDEGQEIERRMGDLKTALEHTLQGSEGPPPPKPPAAESAPGPEPAPRPEPPQTVGPGESEPDSPPAPPASAVESSRDRQRALIRATQLAVQGSDRAEVIATLDREFELADAAAIVEEILGSD